MKRFTVTEDHINLLRNAYVDWNGSEFGAPTINPKRPYGNSDVYSDINRILGYRFAPFIGRNAEDFTQRQMEAMYELHSDLETVLQIFLVTGKMEIGTYCSKDNYERNWEKC